MRICPNCHEEYIDDVSVCPECGRPVMTVDRELLKEILSIKNPRKLITVERIADAEEIEGILRDYKIHFYIARNHGAEDFYVADENLGFARNVIRNFIKRYNRKGIVKTEEAGAWEVDEYQVQDWELYNPEEETSTKIFNGIVIGFVLFAVVILLFGD